METIFAGLKNFLLVNKFLSLSLNEFLQSEIMQKSRSAQYITRIIAVANQVQFVCLFVCCAPPNSVVQINNFFRLILFSAEIRKRRGKKLISKTIKYKLGSSSKMPFALFPERHLFIHLFIYLFENNWYCRKSGMTHMAGGGGGGRSCSLRHYDAGERKSICYSPLNGQ